jgi:small subunit ribosomal protein S16
VAVKIRLKRMGKIRAPYYRIVVADSRTKRDGRVIEEIGKYHPTENPSFIEVKSERAQYWLGVGAQPTEQVMAILKLTGDWGTFKGEKGAKSTVQVAEPKSEFQPDAKKKPVLRPKSAKKEEAPKAESTPESTPEAAPESTPEAAPESTPEAAPESTPEAAPEAADVTEEATASTEVTEAPAEAADTPAAAEVAPAEDGPEAEEAPVAEEATPDEETPVVEAASAAEDEEKKDDN